MTETPESSRFVPVYTAYGHLAGEMVRLLLETQGIPAILTQESVGNSFGLTIGRLGIAKILVPFERVQDAEMLLKAMDEGRLETRGLLERTPEEYKYRMNKIPPAETLKDIPDALSDDL